MTDFSPIAPAEKGRPPTPMNNDPAHTRAREAALQLEASFLSEMLKAAGFGAQQGEFSGGTGEEQFASFHRDAIARKMAEAGGIGLAEHFFRAMMEAQNDT